MFTSKQNVLQTVATLKAHGIDHVVLSPGSRNAPLIHSFCQDPFFQCYSVVDERSAGFFALGLMDKLLRPVVVCCTSGTAVMNYGPAVAEAFYRNLPLVVVSADRTPAWIGQMDGQTVPQPGIFGNLVALSVQLPEIQTDENRWHCNRLVNEALLKCLEHRLPVHINLPISEPLFDFSEPSLPEVRIIRSCPVKKQPHTDTFPEKWQKARKRLILMGQMTPRPELRAVLETLVKKKACVVLCEHLSNNVSPTFVSNFDALLSALDTHETEPFAPSLLITLGGHIVSKRLRQFLRTHPPKSHWHVSPYGFPGDTFQCLTDSVETNEATFLQTLVAENTHDDYWETWMKASARIPEPGPDTPFSDIAVIGTLIRYLPKQAHLFTGNSSCVRNLQLHHLPSGTLVFCNRGTNGIEGTLSTACGYAAIHNGITFLVLGDLSFFYDLNALTLRHFAGNLRILLINNGGGGIFHLLPELDQSPALDAYVAARHKRSAEPWVKAAGLGYLRATNLEELEKNLSQWGSMESSTHMVLEVFTDTSANLSAHRTYYQQLKKP